MVPVHGFTGLLFGLAFIATVSAVVIGPIIGVLYDSRRGNRARAVGWALLWLGTVAGVGGHFSAVRSAVSAGFTFSVRAGNAFAPYEAVLYPVILIGLGIAVLVWQTNVSLKMPSYLGRKWP